MSGAAPSSAEGPQLTPDRAHSQPAAHSLHPGSCAPHQVLIEALLSAQALEGLLVYGGVDEVCLLFQLLAGLSAAGGKRRCVCVCKNYHCWPNVTLPLELLVDLAVQLALKTE